ncbi:TlpA family protein disulfide reductase [Thalassobellus citreus]|uniref:TlpA family protein disulfide reductase n=1 Tax=Thalassobellus citreus TaxID=3367752 RepID=UPI0037933674
MKLFLAVIISSLMLFGCKNNSNKAENQIAYLGGEIINPNTNFIILSRSNIVIDTIDLDGRNRFIKKIDNLKEGIYTFKHGNEFQIVFLEPNDSLLLRLNTIDFDESLVFTGVGAKKNNYLINDFLENEIIEKSIYKYCQLNPKDYQNKLDSLSLLKKVKLNAFLKKYKPSSLFEKIAKTNNKYNYYFSKEVYPLWHHGDSKKDLLKSLPKDFYDYRKNVSYNDSLLKDYNFIYNNFLKSSFNNLALQEHFDHHKEIDNKFKRSDLCYNLDRLKLIDSLVSNPYIKDGLLYHFTVNYISKNKNLKNNEIILNAYLNKSKDEKGKEMITRFTNSINNLKIGSQIPNVTIINYKNDELSINNLVNSPTVISFWSHTYYDHFKDNHIKINDLKRKYPEVKFISINIDDFDIKKSKQFLESNSFSFDDEYHFKNREASIETFAIHPMTKTILIDKNKKIANNNTNIFSRNFEEELLGLINK